MRDFLSIADHTPAELRELLDLAQELKQEWSGGRNRPLLKNQVLAMVFQKPSLRTRVSFDMAMRHLGGDALYLSPAEIGLGKREAIKDISRVLSGYVDCVMARVFAHAHIEELAEHATVPVINGLSDFNHPCQALADVFTIMERFGEMKDLRVAYVGDGNNVAVSLIFASAQLGMHASIATPEGYGLPQEVVERAETLAEGTGASVQVTQDPHVAVAGAQVIYTDTWVSMGQEEESARREALFPPYQVNASLVAEADSSAIVMHCLPAHRGQEITDEVMDGPQATIFQQAENRLHAQKAILVRLLT
jgi:ornithine carbamoyltransferase